MPFFVVCFFNLEITKKEKKKKNGRFQKENYVGLGYPRPIHFFFLVLTQCLLTIYNDTTIDKLINNL